MDAYIVKRIMGHVVADITAGVYTHRSVEDLIREMTKFHPL
jgi:integrase